MLHDVLNDDIRAIEQDIWRWIHEFVTVPNEFYHHKFPPCPYARQAVLAGTVDVAVWRSDDVRAFIRGRANEMRHTSGLTTRVMTFPPRTQWEWGLGGYLDSLNADLIRDNVFLNMGVAQTTTSRYPASAGQPYFIVIANTLDGVLSGSELLKRTAYYKDWPRTHYEIVVERRARLSKRFGRT